MEVARVVALSGLVAMVIRVGAAEVGPVARSPAAPRVPRARTQARVPLQARVRFQLLIVPGAVQGRPAPRLRHGGHFRTDGQTLASFPETEAMVVAQVKRELQAVRRPAWALPVRPE